MMVREETTHCHAALTGQNINDTYLCRPNDYPLAPDQVVFFEELLMSQVVYTEALVRLLLEKGLFTKEEFLEMVKVVDKEVKLKKGNDRS